jgi:UDP-N-acetylmuramoyl-tripeptide--D-alanyl-D-alanine ligase
MITVEEIIEATDGKLLSENSGTFSGVSIDSRTVTENEIFFAIKGEKFDGHDFLENALSKSSGAVVHSEPESFPKGKVIICVDDTLRSLQDLAHFLRMKQSIPVIAVTGSNGKTTTKEMIHAVLSRRFKTLKNEGNLNNLIGLPLSLLKLQSDDEAVVLEMGMNARGEIKKLNEIAAPSHGVITNIGSAHVGMLGSRNEIRNAKLEILQGLNVLVVNADDGFLMNGIKEAEDFNGQIITFAVNNESHVMGKDVQTSESGSSFMLEIRNKESIRINMNVHGLFNVYNALAAASVCFFLGITIKDIKIALESYRTFPMRFEFIKANGITIINDSYNANPSSMEESLKEALHMRGRGRVVALLGDMSELGEFSEKEHRHIGRIVSEMDVDVFIAVGEMMNLAAEEIKKVRGQKPVPEIVTFGSIDEAKKYIMNVLKPGDKVLVKGSRIMSMEKIIGNITDAI